MSLRVVLNGFKFCHVRLEDGISAVCRNTAVVLTVSAHVNEALVALIEQMTLKIVSLYFAF